MSCASRDERPKVVRKGVGFKILPELVGVRSRLRHRCLVLTTNY
jgi:hypothetical protein